jgi:Kef-type K+ transport system membrane component KefB
MPGDVFAQAIAGLELSPALQFILALALIIAAAKLAAWLSYRLRQPAVLGEILVGVLLGPSLINLFGRAPFSDPHLNETIQLLGEIGVLMLMFVAGLEVNLTDLLRVGRVSALAGFLGVLFPIVMTLVVLPFGVEWQPALFLGITLAATSVSISAQTLLELGRLRSRAGLTLLGAAIIDDVLVILALSTFLALAGGASSRGGIGLFGLLIVLARMLLFLGVGGWLAFRMLPRVLQWADRRPVSEGLISMVLVSLLLLAWAAEVIGAIAAITGAFLAGLAITQSRLRHKIEEGMHTLSYGFFVPVFLVGIGLNMDARALGWDDLGLVLVVCLVAIVSKVLGSGLGARLGGLDNRTALQVGAGMISRGEVGLIVAATGLAEALLDERLFALAVIVVIVATLVTPPLLRLLFAGSAEEPAPSREGADA